MIKLITNTCLLSTLISFSGGARFKNNQKRTRGGWLTFSNFEPGDVWIDYLKAYAK